MNDYRNHRDAYNHHQVILERVRRELPASCREGWLDWAPRDEMTETGKPRRRGIIARIMGRKS